MKVLVLTNLFPSPYDPLRAAFNRQQFERLGRRHEVEVLTAIDFRDRLRGPRSDPGIEAVRANRFVFVYPPRIGRSLHAAFWLASLLVQHGLRLRRERYDCVLASWAFPDGVAAARVARMLGIPYAIKVHGSDLNVQASYASRRWQIAAALRGAAAVIAVSAALGRKVRELGVDAERVHVLYNGVDPARFTPGDRGDARTQLGLPNEARILLYVGNLKASKGCLDLLESFPAVLAANPAARLVFVGAGPARAALEQRSRALGLTEQVRLAGAVPHAALGEWFCAADVLCLPSHAEGVPNVVLEAMASGTPVVASHVGGIPEVVPECAGMLVPPHDSAALAQALIAALAREWNPADIVAHGRRFDWEDNVKRMDDILCGIVRQQPIPVGERQA